MIFGQGFGFQSKLQRLAIILERNVLDCYFTDQLLGRPSCVCVGFMEVHVQRENSVFASV